MSTTKKTEIVILGGGGAGTPLAYNLSHAPASSNYHITLINNRPFFQYLLAGARVISTTDGNLEDKSLMPYDHVFANGPDGKPNGTFKQGTAEKVELDEKVIKLTSGEEVKYDYLVLTTGSTWEGALNLPVGSREDAQNYIKDWRKKVANATHVCIVGGGAVGIGKSRFWWRIMRFP
jgi:NADH dehydrogenase FAD-containing subunit